MMIEPGETKKEDESQIPPVPERHDTIAEVIEPETQPEAESAQAPEDESQEFDYEKQWTEIKENFDARITKLDALRKEIFGSSGTSYEKNLDSADRLTQGTKPNSMEALALAIHEKHLEIRGERAEKEKALAEERQKYRLSKIEKI